MSGKFKTAKYKEPPKTKAVQTNVSTDTSKTEEKRKPEKEDKRQIYSIGDGIDETSGDHKHVEVEREIKQDKTDDIMDVDGNRKVEGYSSEEEDLDGARTKTVALDKRPDDKKLPANIQNDRNRRKREGPSKYMSTSDSSTSSGSSSVPRSTTKVVSMQENTVSTILTPLATIPVISATTPSNRTKDEDVIEDKLDSKITENKSQWEKGSYKNTDADLESSESSDSSDSDSDSDSSTQRSLDREIQQAGLIKNEEKSPPSSLPERPQSPVAMALMDDSKDEGMTQEGELTSTGTFLFVGGNEDEGKDMEDRPESQDERMDKVNGPEAQAEIQQDSNDMNKLSDQERCQESVQERSGVRGSSTDRSSSSSSSSSGDSSSSEGSSSSDGTTSKDSGSESESSSKRKTPITPDIIVQKNGEGGPIDKQESEQTAAANREETIEKDEQTFTASALTREEEEIQSAGLKDDISPTSSPHQSAIPVVVIADGTEAIDGHAAQEAELVGLDRSQEVQRIKSSSSDSTEDSSSDSESESESQSDGSSVRKKQNIAQVPQAASISEVPVEKSDEVKENYDDSKEKSDVAKDEFAAVKNESEITKDQSEVIKNESEDTKEELDNKKEESDVMKEEIDVTKEEQDVIKEEQDTTKEEQDVTKEVPDVTKEGQDDTKEESYRTEGKIQNVDVDENKMAAVAVETSDERIMESAAGDNQNKASDEGTAEEEKSKSLAVVEEKVKSSLDEEERVKSSVEEEQTKSTVEEEQVKSSMVDNEKDKATAGEAQGESSSGSSDSSSDSDSDSSDSEGEFHVTHTPDSNAIETRNDVKQSGEQTKEPTAVSKEPQKETPEEDEDNKAIVLPERDHSEKGKTETPEDTEEAAVHQQVETTASVNNDDTRTGDEQTQGVETMEEPSETSDPGDMHGGNDPENVASEDPVAVQSTLPPPPPRNQHSGSVMPLLEGQNDGLELKNMELTKTQWFEVSKFLEKKENLKSVTLSNMAMNDGDFEMVYEALIKSPSNPVIINLNMNALGPQSADSIADLLKDKTSIEILLLQGNPVGDEGIRSLVDGVLDIQFDEQQWRKSETARIPSVISEVEAPVLRKLVGNFCHLRELDLGNTDMTDEGTTDIALLLEHNTDLETLSLQGNKYITRWTKIGKSLTKNRKLVTLTLDYNKVGDEGVEALVEGLKDNSCVQTIDLINTGIGEKGGAMLVELLKKNTTLLELTLTPGNSIPQVLLDDIKNYLNLNQSINV